MRLAILENLKKIKYSGKIFQSLLRNFGVIITKELI